LLLIHDLFTARLGKLSDAMGLGKTVQTLAHIAKLKEPGKIKEALNNAKKSEI